MKTKVLRIMSAIFEQELDENSDISMQNEPSWDSMKQVEIFTTLEDELGLDLFEQMSSLCSLKDIKIQKRV